MSTYREIVGKKIKKVSSDPSSGLDGEMWYNTTTGNLRGIAVTEGISSASPLVYTNFSGGTFGTQTAAVVGGGYAPPTNPPGNPPSQQTQHYNGTGWSLGGNLTLGRADMFGFGVETAGVVAGGTGSPTPWVKTEEYNGTSWTAGGDLGTGRRGMEGAGTETAGMVCGGYVGPAGTTSTEEYGGTSWTAGGALTTSNPINYYNAVTGTQTAGLRMGGQGTNVSEEYDGSSWTSGNTMGTPRAYGGSFGSQTAALIAGGSNPPTSYKTAVEKYDGTSFTASPATLSSPRALTGQAAGGISGNTAGIFAGGYSPTDSPTGDYGNRIVEEYNVSTNIITAGAWASGGAMTTARNGLASAGTQTANVFIGGQMSNSPYAPLDTVELYNGTTWSSNPNNAPYSASNNCGTGTQTAALSWGGYPNVSTTLEFDGSAFSTGGSLSTGRELTSNNIGIQTAAIAASGFQRPGTYPTQTEEYNGSSWTGGPVVNTPRYSAAGAGTTTAELFSGGIEPGQLSNAEEYNGSSWTNVTSRPFAAGNTGTSGTQTASLAYGGNPGGALTTTVSYDGTSWATSPSMAQARAMMGSSAGGTSTAALASSGAAPTATEEFTGQTETANIENFTTS